MRRKPRSDAAHRHAWDRLKIGRKAYPIFVCSCGAIRAKEAVIGKNTISNSPGGVDVLRWSASQAPVAAGDIGMDVASGRPRAFIFGAATDLGGADIACRVRHNANQNIPNLATTAVAFNTEDYDTDAMHDNAVNNTRITFNRAGKYLVVGQAQWAPNVAGLRDIFLRLNGVTAIAAHATEAINSVIFGNVQVCATVYSFAATDYIELMALQSSGGGLNIETQGAYSPVMVAQKIDRGG